MLLQRAQVAAVHRQDQVEVVEVARRTWRARCALRS